MRRTTLSRHKFSENLDFCPFCTKLLPPHQHSCISIRQFTARSHLSSPNPPRLFAIPFFLLLLLSIYLPPCICAFHWSYLCSVLFSTPRLVKKQGCQAWSSQSSSSLPTRPAVAGGFMAESSLRPRVRSREESARALETRRPSGLTRRLVLSPLGHVGHRGATPLTALLDTHSSAPAQSPGATDRLFIFYHPHSFLLLPGNPPTPQNYIF